LFISSSKKITSSKTEVITHISELTDKMDAAAKILVLKISEYS